MAGSRGKGITFFQAEKARPLDEEGMMSPARVDQSVYQELDLSPISGGSDVRVLFRSEGPDAFSLVHARFQPGYRLPRHTHSTDCLYFVVSGEAIMGNRVIPAGDGFFVRANSPYAYAAGEEGAEVLEFRASTSFDINVLDQTVERWRAIVEAATANRHRWSVPAEDS
jgi:quercetin dioxygenase-like cupin family protein